MHHDPNPFDEGADDNPFSVTPDRPLLCSLPLPPHIPRGFGTSGVADLGRERSPRLARARAERGSGLVRCRMEEEEVQERVVQAASRSSGSGRRSPSGSAAAGATRPSTSPSTP
jgi:hypothetical protein